MDNNNKKELSKKQVEVLTALKSSLGIISKACTACNIARSTFYDWINTNEEFAAKVKEMDELVLDFAETALYKAIEKGNIAAIIFFLKNKGKSRGYENDNYHQEQKEPQKIQIEILPNNPEVKPDNE